MNWFKNAVAGFKSGKTPAGVYTDSEPFTSVTEADWESEEPSYYPVAIGVRRRWEQHKPDRKVVGYK